MVWSNRAQKRAVIWCDNQGGLAYLNDGEQFRDEGWPEVGDTVRLKGHYDAGLTYARNVSRMGSLETQQPPPDARLATARTA